MEIGDGVVLTPADWYSTSAMYRASKRTGADGEAGKGGEIAKVSLYCSVPLTAMPRETGGWETGGIGGKPQGLSEAQRGTCP